jgi:hypothetical protein
MSRIVEYRNDINRVDANLQDAKDKMYYTQQSMNDQLETISKSTRGTHSSVLSLRNIGQQLLVFLETFSTETRKVLEKILRTDLRTYHLLLQVQRDIAASPTGLLKSNIKFEDAIGRFRELPYEYFRYWEVSLSTLLLCMKHYPLIRQAI